MGSYKHFHPGQHRVAHRAALVPLAIAGSYLGAWLTTHIPADNLKRAFGAFIILVGAKLLFFK